MVGMRYVDTHTPTHRLRRVIAFPFYFVALLFSFASSALGWIAERIAGDN